VCIHLVSVLFKPSTGQNKTDNVQADRNTILFYFLWPIYLFILWPGNVLILTWLTLRLLQIADFLSVVAKDCPCDLFKLFMCYHLLFWDCSGVLLPGGRLRQALTFSYLWVSPAECVSIYYKLIPTTAAKLYALGEFSPINLLPCCPSPSPHFLQCCLSLLPHHNKYYN